MPDNIAVVEGEELRFIEHATELAPIPAPQQAVAVLRLEGFRVHLGRTPTAARDISVEIAQDKLDHARSRTP